VGNGGLGAVIYQNRSHGLSGPYERPVPGRGRCASSPFARAGSRSERSPSRACHLRGECPLPPPVCPSCCPTSRRLQAGPPRQRFEQERRSADGHDTGGRAGTDWAVHVGPRVVAFSAGIAPGNPGAAGIQGDHAHILRPSRDRSSEPRPILSLSNYPEGSRRRLPTHLKRG